MSKVKIRSNHVQHVEFDLDFKRNPHQGRYIVLEGIDGSGKSVQSQELAAVFEKQGKKVHLVSEPRRTGIIGNLINELLHKKIKLPAESLQYLFVADRIAHQEEVIIPALKKGEIVISHRNFWSSIPYGIMDISKGDIQDNAQTLLIAQCILSTYFQVMVPDVTIYLDVSAAVALKRLDKSGQEKEYYETEGKLRKVHHAYEWIIEKFPHEFVRINGDQEIKKVTDDIISCIK
ncbi:MAG: dTMP kinase [Candidatus Levyibacteriota bacterium]